MRNGSTRSHIAEDGEEVGKWQPGVGSDSGNLETDGLGRNDCEVALAWGLGEGQVIVWFAGISMDGSQMLLSLYQTWKTRSQH